MALPQNFRSGRVLGDSKNVYKGEHFLRNFVVFFTTFKMTNFATWN